MGDPAGVGPEIAVKSSEYFIKKGGPIKPVILGSYGHIEQTAKNIVQTRVSLNSVKTNLPLEASYREGLINVADLSSMPYGQVKTGMLNPAYAKDVEKFIESAVDFSIKGRISGFATAPINKDMMLRGGARFGGHTELLGYLSSSENFAMLFYSRKLITVLATIHVPVSAVPSMITKESLRRVINISVNSMKKDFGKTDPRVAILGLNPHAGENGEMGSEEIKVIGPVIGELADGGLRIEGPFPSDSFFAEKYKYFDLVVSMYHDQALIPFKLFSFHKGVNVTVGLDIVRTSPVHGTAYDIAGKNTADCGSMIESVKLAYSIARNRKKWTKR